MLILILFAGLSFAGNATALNLKMISSSNKIRQGQPLTVDIVTDNPAGLSGAVFSMTYPSDILSLDPVPVTTDYFPAGNWQANANSPGSVALVGMIMESGGLNTKLFTIRFKVNDTASSGLYNLTLAQTGICNGPAGWGTDVNENGVFDEGDAYKQAPLLYTVAYQKETEEVLTSILMESFASNPQLAFRVQASGKGKSTVVTSRLNSLDDAAIQPDVSAGPIVLKNPSENKFGVSVSPVLEVTLSTDFAVPDNISQMLWQISRGEDFNELVFETVRQLDRTELQIPRFVLDPHSIYYWRANGVGADGMVQNWSTATMFATGVGDMMDLNGNGIPDNQDLDIYEDRITSQFPDINAVGLKILKGTSGEKQFAIATGEGTLLIDLARWENSGETIIPDDAKVIYPSGLLAFRSYVANPGATASVTLYYLTPIRSDFQWRSYDPKQGWFYVSSSNAVIGKDRKTVVLNLIDGEAGDADGTANGIIVTLSGPSIRRK